MNSPRYNSVIFIGIGQLAIVAKEESYVVLEEQLELLQVCSEDTTTHAVRWSEKKQAGTTRDMRKGNKMNMH